MIDVREHVYADDPAAGHPDVRTRLRDVAYYFLGNGHIQAAVQVAPGGEGTPCGLLIQDPSRLTAKREALTMDGAGGLEPTRLRLEGADGAPAGPASGAVARWGEVEGVPHVEVAWEAWPAGVEERFSCPDRQRPVLVRTVRVFNRSNRRFDAVLRTGIPDAEIALPVSLGPGDSQAVHLHYTLVAGGAAGEGRPRWRVKVEPGPAAPPAPDAVEHAGEQLRLETGRPALDHLFRSAASQLSAVVTSAGRVDAGIWQYTREWVRDHSFMAVGLLLAGHHGQARTMLERLLREFVAEDGATCDSSERRELPESELDQNGILLMALALHLWWTGDEALARAWWPRVSAVAEFPLSAAFRHQASGLLSGRRDFWERHAAHGLQPGLELAHQFFVALGLEAAASMARRLGWAAEAARWQAEAGRLRAAALHHPVFRLVEGDRLVKRLGLDGRAQRAIDPLPGANLPAGVGLAGPPPHPLDPDSVTALAVAWGFVDPRSALAGGTLREVERLWNQRWDDGGYGRYHAASDPDSPGAWPLVSAYVARAYLEMGRDEAVWRVLDWLGRCPGSASGAWFEMHGPRIAPPSAQVGIVPWAWAELILLFVHHLLGVRPGERGLLVCPRPLRGLDEVSASLRLRGRRVDVRVVGRVGGAGRIETSMRVLEETADGYWLEYPDGDARVDVTVAVPGAPAREEPR